MSRSESEVVRSPDAEMVRSEEVIDADVQPREVGDVRARTSVTEHDVEQLVPRDVEFAEIERHGPTEADSGQIETLPDGSISIPVFEEKLVIEKRLVVRERVIVRKRRVTEEQRVQATLRREHVDVEADDSIADRVHDAAAEEAATPASSLPPPPPPPPPSAR